MFPNSRCGLRQAVLGFIFLMLGGCGAKNDTPPLAPVKGIVTLDGKPLPRGSVQFLPDRGKGTSGRMGIGKIEADGTFQMTTIKPDDGAQIGFHKVAIQSHEAPAPGAGIGVLVSLIPESYADPETSGLTAEVKKGRNDFTFELSGKP